ncbi:MAG: tyrosine-protein phosphatase [Enterococcus sp.]
MIDTHCHILPGIDDGAQTMEESILMAREAIRQGITHILCTPHHNNGKYTNEKAKVLSLVTQVQEELTRRNLDLVLLEGQEIRITGDLVKEMRADRLLFTDTGNRYLLIEFPTASIPAYTEQVFFELLNHGKIPVIVHPERNAKFREDPNYLATFLEMGALAQLTAPSYVGVFGKAIQKTAKEMVAANLVQLVASDAHSINSRTFYLKEAYHQIEKDFGVEKIQQMKQVAKDLVNGDDINYPTYLEIKKKRFVLF